MWRSLRIDDNYTHYFSQIIKLLFYVMYMLSLGYYLLLVTTNPIPEMLSLGYYLLLVTTNPIPEMLSLGYYLLLVTTNPIPEMLSLGYYLLLVTTNPIPEMPYATMPPENRLAQCTGQNTCA